ncbi:hypothetical protein IID20_01660, partial [Patescibacteria group bacterium]|nr:hypothetical protein [Patescibacteria group bacterium]
MSSNKAQAKVLNILLSVGIIAFIVVIFFVFYGQEAKNLEKTIEAEIKGLTQNTILLSLMNVKTLEGKTVAEHLVTGVTGENQIAAATIASQLKRFYGSE